MYGLYLWIGTIFIAVKYKKHILKSNTIQMYLQLIFAIYVFKLIRALKDRSLFEWMKEKCAT